jgi:hypothetical protein
MKIKPCAFCGEHVVFEKCVKFSAFRRRFFVECQRCLCQGPVGSKADTAIEFWNLRKVSE